MSFLLDSVCFWAHHPWLLNPTPHFHPSSLSLNRYANALSLSERGLIVVFLCLTSRLTGAPITGLSCCLFWARQFHSGLLLAASPPLAAPLHSASLGRFFAVVHLAFSSLWELVGPLCPDPTVCNFPPLVDSTVVRGLVLPCSQKLARTCLRHTTLLILSIPTSVDVSVPRCAAVNSRIDPPVCLHQFLSLSLSDLSFAKRFFCTLANSSKFKYLRNSGVMKEEVQCGGSGWVQI